MTNVSDDDDDDDDDESDGVAWFDQFRAFIKTERVVRETRQITITREMLETAFEGDIVEPVTCKMLGVQTGAEAEAVLSSFSIGQRRLYAVYLYMSEVRHGGHEYFFQYSGGLVWPDALAGLEMIGALQARDILQQAIHEFPEPPSLEYNARNEALENMSTAGLDALDSPLWDGCDQIYTAMRAYILAHPEEFVWSGTVEETKRPDKWAYVDGELKWIPKDEG